MSYIRKYLQNARNFVNETQLGYDGSWDWTGDADGGDFFGAEGDTLTAPTPPVQNMRTSQPYIISVSNASATAVSNFDVLGAYQYLQNSGFSSGSLTIGSVTIRSAISNITYQEFLYQSMNSPFSVGMTYVESVSGSATQVSETLTLNTRDANGNQALKTLVPTIDPYQYQSGIVVLNQAYDIDGFTKITIATVLASAVFRLHFYPKANLNIARGLRGTQVAADYRQPGVVKSNIAVVGDGAIKARLG
jgi:hypothetical protein